MQINLYP